MKEKFVENGIEYVKCGDYYLPNLTAPTEQYQIGIFGKRHESYIKQAIIDTDGKILHKFSPEELKGVPLNYEFKFYNGVTYNEYATKVTASQGELTQVHGDYYLCSSETPSMYNDYTYINVKLIDISTNSVLIDFGEYKVCGSNYSVPNSTYYLNGYFLTTVKNAQGAIYCCLFNESGEPVFEPIRLEDNYSDKHYELTDEGFIIKKDNGENTILYFCDYKGNLTTLYSIPKDYIHGIKLEGFQDGLALIKITENWDSEYKFVNIKGEIMY